MTANPGARAASGARILGDDVQHLIVWYHVLKALQKDTSIEKLAVEAAGAGNVDDLTLERGGEEADEYWQVKASVDAVSPLNEAYLFEAEEGKKSILKRLYESWLTLSARKPGVPPHIVLATTKVIDHSDPVLSNRATTDARVCETLRHSTADRIRWAAHIGISEDSLLSFLECLYIRHGLSESEWREKVRDVAGTVGIKADEQGIATGLQQVRNWVKSPRQVFTPQELLSIISTANLVLPNKEVVLVVQMLEISPRHTEPDYKLDFISLFNGVSPDTRRELISPDNEKVIFNGLQEVRNKLKRDSIYQVEVDGSMRCPLWFLTGKQLSMTPGTIVRTRTPSGMWSSSASAECDAEMVRVVLSNPREGSPLAISINLSLDIGEEVQDYIDDSLPEVVQLKLSLTKPGSRGIRNAEHAKAIAMWVRDEMRKVVREFKPSSIHLFLGMPGWAALLIGHQWDRLPSTTLYWDMGKPGKYSKSFEIN